MKIIITSIITLGIAVGFALIALEDPGFVTLARSPYTMRLPLALFVLAVLIAFAGLYLLFNFVVNVVRIPKRMRAWKLRRNQAYAQTCTMRGYAGLIEGDWSKAEKKLLTNLQYNQSPLLNYLGAAYAAQQQGHLRRRDQYLNDALEEYPTQWLAIRLTTARLHFHAGEIPSAQETLEQLRKRAPKNLTVLRLLADVYREVEDWNALVMLVPTLVRLKAFPPEELAMRENLMYAHYLSSPTLIEGDHNRATRAFNALPATSKKTPHVIASYCRQLIEVGDHVLAEKKLRSALNHAWDAELAYLYGKAETSFVADQLKLAQSWQEKYGEHIDLTLTLARLYRRDKQFEKAQELFTQVIADGRCEDACADLGALLEEVGDKDAALLCYRQGMASALGGDRASPLPPASLDVLEARDVLDVSIEEAQRPGVMPVVR